jgi:riboflavin synthase
MFTGIIEAIGTLEQLQHDGSVVRLGVRSDLDLSSVKLGDSIAIDGVCLTVTSFDVDAGKVTFDVGPESLRVTALGRLKPGSRVHLERAMAMGGRLDGHLVQGHVDGVGKLAARRPDGDTLHLRFTAAPEILQLCIMKGSIAISGTSLTINALDDDAFEVWLIPHTLEQTVLGELKVGDEVNLENDLIGKYVQRLLGGGGGGGATGGVTWDTLRKAGFLAE